MAPAGPVRFGPYLLDPHDQRLWRADQALSVPPKAFDLLSFLVARGGRLATKQELLDALWPDAYVSDAVLKVAVAELRRVLGDRAQAPQWIQTVHRRGYRFIGEIERAEPATAAIDVAPTAPVVPAGEPSGKVVGRGDLLEGLSRSFDEACGGQRRTVFLTGEPGVGKTAIVDLFVEQASRAAALVAHGQCRESYGEGEAYQPILEALGELCREDTRDEVLPALRRHAPSWLIQMPWILEDEERGEIELAARGARRERMLREIAEGMEAVARVRPLVLILEDLHWSDPSTLDVVSTLAQRTASARLLVVGTFRPIDAILSAHPVKSLKQDLVARGRCVELAVRLLDASEVAEYLRRRLGDEPPPDLVDLVYRRTEGNALFMTTFVADLVDQGFVEGTDEGLALRRPLSEIEEVLPDELKQILERHVERLAPESLRVLECASVVGRDFTSAVVATALDDDPSAVEQRLEELGRRDDFVRTTGAQRTAVGALTGGYRFGHVLHQHALYARLGHVRRAELHGRVADQLAAAGAGPAQLAYHYHAAGRIEEAIDGWERAGQQAMARWANVEATRHLEKALELLGESPESPERDARELALLTAIGPTIGALHGPGAPRVEAIYDRARALCERPGRGAEVYPVLGGLFTFYVARARMQEAHEVAQQLRAVSEELGDHMMQRSARLLCGVANTYLGELGQAAEYLESTIEMGRDDPAYQWGYSVDSIACAFASQIRQMIGDPDGARSRADEALALARRVGDLYTESMVLHFASVVHRWRGDVAATLDCVTRVLAISEEQRLELWQPVMMWTSGWAEVHGGGDVDAGLAAMAEALKVYGETGTDTARTEYLGSLAAAHLAAGDAAAGLRLVEEALAQVERSNERFFEAELYRVRGALLVAASDEGAPPDPQAEGAVRRALEIARRQGARTWELRAAMTLCAIRDRIGDAADARDLLAGVCAQFPTDLETPDLVAARHLLAT